MNKVKNWKTVQGISNDHFGRYTIVNYKQMKKYDLSFSEYCLTNYIYNTSQRTAGKFRGVSKARPATIAKDLGMTERYVYMILKELVTREDPMLEKHKGGYKVFWNKEWTNARERAGIEKNSCTKFDNDSRKNLKLTFLEYALLKYLERLILTSSSTVTSVNKTAKNKGLKVGQRVTSITKKALAKGIGTDRETISRMMKRLEKRKFISEMVIQENGDPGKKTNNIWLIIDMDKEKDYAVQDTYYCESQLYLPNRTIEVTEDDTDDNVYRQENGEDFPV